ncbi:oxygen-dependent tRNA uridine(34) hydroxylase TrhO [Stieleria varia]|uniref:tRNA uridine(34) hydroxylase n=1 Tax=Stieleria varia TaxID=2528005 RepID=A0A5C6B2B6_9BACT|nr:rhodanese-related sulfurtransferase [Stieleria varia]TWU06455.1 putative rhodanese-related sulfurtransferase [Stieleria varia]
MNASEIEPQIVVAALYRFVRLPQYGSLRQPIQSTMNRLHVRGTLLLAAEGINGTVAGSREGIDGLLAYLRAIPEFAATDVKESHCSEMPFKRSRVRLKKEIVTLGVEGIDPNETVGTYVDPAQWNELISDPNVTLVDTRNDYEVAIGTFPGAVNPETETFREFPEFVDRNLDPERHPKIAMFCTGGIRCEKSTALLKKKGFKEVYHLRGGILKYLEEIPAEESKWQGECFVFDQRVSVGQGLAVGPHTMCYACGWPLTPADREHPDFIRGVQCGRCAAELTEEQRARFAERQHQLDLQEARSTAPKATT